MSNGPSPQFHKFGEKLESYTFVSQITIKIENNQNKRTVITPNNGAHRSFSSFPRFIPKTFRNLISHVLLSFLSPSLFPHQQRGTPRGCPQTSLDLHLEQRSFIGSQQRVHGLHVLRHEAFVVIQQ